MKKFEKPVISVSLFDTENVITTSGDPQPQALDKAKTAITNSGIAEANIMEFTF